MNKKKKNELDEIRNFIGEVNKEITQNNSKNIIAYCRVSNSKQIGNHSPEVQLNGVKYYAQNNNLNIIKDYNIQGESSKKGVKRPSIDELFKFIDKSKDKIHSIVVFHSSRLTRDGAYGARFLDRLITRGIGFTDISSPNDIFTDDGRLRQINAFYGAEQDNVTRKRFINTTILEKLKQGHTMGNVPRGYKSIKIGKGRDKKRKIIITSEGKLIKEAFQIKLHYNYSNVKICEMMKPRGLDITPKALGRIFKNVYYCGLIKDKRLVDHQGIVEGLHPKMVDVESFKIINSIGGRKKRQIRANEIEELPLRKHLICSDCNEKMTGYKASKRKALFYYKCRTKGCKLNIRNEKLHLEYLELLSRFTFDDRYKPQLITTLKTAFKELNKSNKKTQKCINERLTSVANERKIAIRNMNVNIDCKDEFKELLEILNSEIAQLKKQLADVQYDISNVEANVNRAVDFICDLPDIWEKSNFNIRVGLQHLMFPDGVLYDKKSNILKPVSISPIFKFLSDYKGKIKSDDKLLLEKDSTFFQQRNGEENTNFRTFNDKEKMLLNPCEYECCDDVQESLCKEELPNVATPSDGSNNFTNKLYNSLIELFDFEESYGFINKYDLRKK